MFSILTIRLPLFVIDDLDIVHLPVYQFEVEIKSPAAVLKSDKEVRDC